MPRASNGDDTGSGATQPRRFSRQAKRVNSGVRPTVLYREAETGKRRMRGLEASGVLAAVHISSRRGNRIAMRDVVGCSAGELIRFLNHIIVIFEE
jgi:hypothetical protein